MIFEEASIRSIFHDHIYVASISQSIPQFNDVRVIESVVNFDLSFDYEKLSFFKIVG